MIIDSPPETPRCLIHFNEALPLFRLTVITRDPEHAAQADLAGIDRIGIDIERVGKNLRQGHIVGARISDHKLHDLNALRLAVIKSDLFARLNPIYDGTRAEIDEAVSYGAQVLMLPYFKTAKEVETFVRLVDARTKVTLLLETATAVVRLHEILSVAGIDEILVGLNDLSLSCELQSPFELLASNLLDYISADVRAAGIAFGFGGLARANDNLLPVPSDLVIAQHPRLGSSAAWLSRSFFSSFAFTFDLVGEVKALRHRLAYWYSQPMTELVVKHNELRRHISELRCMR